MSFQAFTRMTVTSALILSLASCSMPPTRTVTVEEFRRLKLTTFFDIENSPEEIVEHLNRDGEVVFEGRSREGAGKSYYIRVMATPDGLRFRTFPVED